MNRYWKMVQLMVTLTKHAIYEPDLHCAGPLALWGFLQHLPAKYKWRPKKSFYLSARRWHCAIWQIRRWLLYYVHKKFRWGPEVVTFRTKTFDFNQVIHLNWLEKIELRECAGPPGRQYNLLLINVVRVYCCTQKCQKKLKMKKQGFFVKFLSLVAFWLRGPGPPRPPPGYAYDFETRSCP